MHTSPHLRTLKRVLLESLHRYREFGELPEKEFTTRMDDYPAYLRSMADTYEEGRTELAVEEKPRFEAYTDWAESYDDETSNPVIAGEDLVLDQLLAPLPKATILDVGAGTGRHAVALARSGSQVTASEPNTAMLTRAQAKAAAEQLDIEFVQSDVYQPLDDDRVFDLVLCCLVLSHVENLQQALTALAKHLKPDGHLVVTDFHPYNLLVGMRTSYSHEGVKYYVPNSIHLPSEYFELASQAGLKLDKFRESGTIQGYPRLPATLVLVFSRNG